MCRLSLVAFEQLWMKKKHGNVLLGARETGEDCYGRMGIAEFAGLEFAGLENDGQENDEPENDGLENDGVEQEQT